MGLLDYWQRRVRQFVCGFRGHMELLCRQPDRVWLKCALCDTETPGIALDTWRVRYHWRVSRREMWEQEQQKHWRNRHSMRRRAHG